MAPCLFLNHPSQAREMNAYSIHSALWQGIKDRFVTCSQIHPVLVGFKVGIFLGASSAWMIDFVFREKRNMLIGDSFYKHERLRSRQICNFNNMATEEMNILSPQEKNLENRLRTIFVTNISIFLTSCFLIFTMWKTADFETRFYGFSSLALGSIVGTQLFEYYTNNSLCKIKEFIGWLKENTEINSCHQLDLSFYSNYLRRLNLNKLRQEIHKEFPDCYGLILRGCRLTDYDLKLLKEAGWFKLFNTINISDNSKLTVTGLKYLGEGEIDKLGTLDLSGIDLTDNDLMEMAKSGFFKKLKNLIIRDNPKITGKGLIYLSENGFEKLEVLDLGGNSQLLGNELNSWIAKCQFKNLTALGLSYTKITEEDLEKIIKEATWFRNLNGVDLDGSKELFKFPSNISQMTNLSKHGISLSQTLHGNYPIFEGFGLFFRNHNEQFKLTEEFISLLKAEKAYFTIK